LTSFGVIGSVGRCEFCLRLARMAPDRLRAAEGLQEHLISVAIGESLATGRDVTTTTEARAR
jgi:hypothetical protein